MAKILLITLSLLILSLIPHSLAEIKTHKFISETRHMILLDKFGFTHTGHVSVRVSSVSVTMSDISFPEASRFGFFLLSEESLLHVLLQTQQDPSFCLLDSQYTTPLFTFRHLSPSLDSSFNGSYPVSVPTEYNLFFANCNPESSVSMDVSTEMYNLEFNGVKNYSSAAHTRLPSFYLPLFLRERCPFIGFVFSWLDLWP